MNPFKYIKDYLYGGLATYFKVMQDKKARANFEIGFDWPGPGKKHPVHESIAIAAFMRSNMQNEFPQETTYDNLTPQQWEYFRGMIWNDDPSCLLFNGSETDNRSWGTGWDFFREFKFGKANRMTQRSHFGNLQFLHSMGSVVGEQPNDTRERLLLWMGVMYKLACGNQGVQENDALNKHFPDQFNGDTDPSQWATLRDLIVASTPQYRDTQISRRALGICLHMIQDSYAVGHTQRRLLNPEDFNGRDHDGYINFKPTTWGKWGAIVSFHTYSGQDDDRHGFYDGLEGASLPDPTKLNSYNRLHGARDAIDGNILLMNAFAKKQSWDKVRQELETKVFALDSEAQPCNTDVDSKIPGLDEKPKSYYQTKSEYKLEGLESALPANHSHGQRNLRTWFRERARRWFLILLSLLFVGKMTLVLYFVLCARG